MDEIVVVLCLVALAAALFFGGVIIGHSAGYKQGQIDYSNGIKKYCLATQADSSKIWERCDEK